MTKSIDTVVEPVGGSVTKYPIQILETRPESITWHVIWDHELEKITNISRPIILGLATTLLGGFLGLLPMSLGVIRASNASSAVTLEGLAAVIVAALCLSGFVALGFFSIRGQ